MQRVAATVWSPASDRNIYIVWIGAVWAAILGGFGLDFARYMGEAPPPPPILHVHAAAFVLWLALVFGAALLWTGEIITTVLNFSPTWRDMMVRLVNAWGYTG